MMWVPLIRYSCAASSTIKSFIMPFLERFFILSLKEKLVNYHELKVHIYQSSFIKQANIEMKISLVYFGFFCLISKECWISLVHEQNSLERDSQKVKSRYASGCVSICHSKKSRYLSHVTTKAW
jgi:hypothetical protein